MFFGETDSSFIKPGGGTPGTKRLMIYAMDIELIPTRIVAMQKDIAQLKKRINALDGGKKAGEVRLLLKDGSIYNIDELDNEAYDISEVDGIVIPVLDGREFLLYPKYEIRKMLKGNQIENWKASRITQFESMYSRCNGKKETDELLSIESPTAEFVRNVAVHREFNLPGDILAAVAIVHYLDEINAIAEHIHGAGKIDEYSAIWTCSRTTPAALGTPAATVMQATAT